MQRTVDIVQEGCNLIAYYQEKILDDVAYGANEVDVDDFWQWVQDNERNKLALWPHSPDNSPGIEDLVVDFDDYLLLDPYKDMDDYLNWKKTQKYEQ